MALVARLRALDGPLLGERWESVLLRQLEVQVGVKQVAGEPVATGDPQEGLEVLACLPLSGAQGLLGDLQSFWEGEKGTGGMRRVGGPPHPPSFLSYI